ncbi:MAG: LacI family DNA-binding transcriptional regulator [Rikenellaceae bacterium]
MRSRHFTTIKDIAKAMGLSTSTVSRALSDSWDVKPETRAAVLAVAEQMNYKPNPIAQKLRTRRTKSIGVVVPEFMNSFFPQAIMGMQSVLNEQGYQLLITQSNESIETEALNIKLLEGNMVEGMIISVTKDGSNLELYKKLIASGVSLVFFNRAHSKVAAPKVMAEDRRMACEIVHHLYGVGCRHIAHIAGPSNLHISSLRKEGYMEGLASCGVSLDDSLIFECAEISDAEGYRIMNNILESGVAVDGLFAFSDPLAIGAMKAIKERGLKIPEDIAMVGFSDSRSAQIVEPQLSSVAQPTFEMGATAARLLLRMINGDRVLRAEEMIYLDSTLKIRASSMR